MTTLAERIVAGRKRVATKNIRRRFLKIQSLMREINGYQQEITVLKRNYQEDFGERFPGVQ